MSRQEVKNGVRRDLVTAPSESREFVPEESYDETMEQLPGGFSWWMTRHNHPRYWIGVCCAVVVYVTVFAVWRVIVGL
jgi:hypothetical protein